MDDRARLFVAAWPPAEVCDLLAALPRPVIEGVRYTSPDQWHVTLRFLGEVSLREATDAFAALRFSAAEATVGPSVARLGKSVVMVAVRGLDEIAAAVAVAMDGVGRPPDYDEFTGHLTLARLETRGRRPTMLGAAIDATFAVRELHLVRSRLSSSGPRYETVTTSSAS